VKFILLGNGPRRDDLIKLKNKLKADNVLFIDSVPKSQMPSILKSVDVGIVPLRNVDLFLGAIPSKIFELLAMRKPVLLGVDGEAKHLFVDEGRCGIFFRPEDADHLAEQVKSIMLRPEQLSEMGERGWNYVNTKFNRDRIADEFWARLCET
jgi:glycosyltransferase involved in cell wall biosynthesis